jgi:hypothetical protein
VTPLARRLLGVAAGAAISAGVYYGGARRVAPLGGGSRWVRTNHRGEPVTLWAGPAAGVGAVVGGLLTPGVPGRVRAAGVVAGTAAALLGGYDDLAGDADAKGLRGHVGALVRGELTTGGAKLVGIGLAGLVAGATVRPRGSGVIDRVLAGVLVAGSANLLNLLDLRPGRALKVVLAGSAVATTMGSPAAELVAAPAGAAVALLAADLREQTMLGDAGANALGAVLGVAGAAGVRSRWGLATTVGGVVGLTLLSERVSFTAVIEGTPVLRELDAWGRRPAR